MKTFCNLAQENIEILMPSYTHFQPAQIIRVSHWLMNHCEALRTGSSRFKKGAHGFAAFVLSQLLWIRNPPILQHQISRLRNLSGFATKHDFATFLLFN